jgi:hypothetical protein
MREMTKSAVAVAREALAVGEASLPRYASKYSRRDGFTLPQLFACLAVRKFLGQDYRGVEALLGEWSDPRAAIGLPRVPDHSTLCLAEAKLAAEGGRPTASCPGASTGPGRSGCSTPGRTPTRPPGRPRSTRPGSGRGTRRPTSGGGAGAGAGT